MTSLSLSIACASGARVIPAAWIGRALAVHRPPTRDGGVSRSPRLWAVSHAASGLSAGLVRARKADAIALARAWDDAFADPDLIGLRSRWPLASQWGDAIRAAGQTGMIFPPNPDAVDPIPAADNDGDALPLSVDFARSSGMRCRVAGHAGARRPEIMWRGDWWPAPTDADLDRWTLDSVCESPDGRTVEPDAPDSWLRLLRLV